MYVLASLACVLTCLAFAQDTSNQSQVCVGPYKIGFKIVDIPSGPKVAVWYPTDQTTKTYRYASGPSTRLAKDAEATQCRRFPLVVFSHGLGGCGTQSIFFTEQLARFGYIVMAPDHKDATCRIDGTGKLQMPTPDQSFLKPLDWTEVTYANRARDLSRLIDWALKSEFAKSIDSEHIGAAGHSVGGYTVLGMVGGWTSWRDQRIKAALLFSPYALPFSVRKQLNSIAVPVMYQGAGLDLGITPLLRGREGAFAITAGSKFYVELKGGSHFEWTNLVCLGKDEVSDCVATKPNAKLITVYGAAFFDRFLRGETEAMKQLSGSGLADYQTR